jgi:L-aminopeptidase/D-esterase-like protein
VILTGGSVYGLSTADGVVRRLSDAGIGFPLSEGFVAPIVPAVALFDLGRGRHYIPPIGPEWGKAAYDAASNGPVPLGCVGAGTGAVSGGIKGGIGSASEILDSGITVAALIAVNSLGSTLNPTTGMLWEIGSEVNGEFGLSTTQAVVLPESRAPESPSNTTIGVVAVDACLTKAQAQKIAQMAHDGLARAIRPAHTMFDGDTIFCLSTGTRPLPVSEGFFQAPYAQSINEIGRAAADCTARAIVRAVLEAVSVAGIPSLCDLESRS